MARPSKLAQDVSAASAAYLVNLLPGLAEAPMEEAFDRLRLSFEAAIAAYRFNARRLRRRHCPEPSDN